MFLAWQHYNIFYAVTLGHLLHSTQNGAFMLMLGMSTIIFIIRHGNRVQCTIIHSQILPRQTFPQNFSTNLESKSSASIYPLVPVFLCKLLFVVAPAQWSRSSNFPSHLTNWRTLINFAKLPWPITFYTHHSDKTWKQYPTFNLVEIVAHFPLLDVIIV